MNKRRLSARQRRIEGWSINVSDRQLSNSSGDKFQNRKVRQKVNIDWEQTCVLDMVILLVTHAPLAQFLIFLTWPYAPMAQFLIFLTWPRGFYLSIPFVKFCLR